MLYEKKDIRNTKMVQRANETMNTRKLIGFVDILSP